jgi:hypothetical protein
LLRLTVAVTRRLEKRVQTLAELARKLGRAAVEQDVGQSCVGK